jgi:hypothetical protein
VCADISSRNLKHILKHLAALQALDHAISLEDIVRLGQQIASRPENMIGTPGGRKTFEEIVTIGSEQVRVRVVLNPSGGLRSVHRRK